MLTSSGPARLSGVVVNPVFRGDVSTWQHGTSRPRFLAYHIEDIAAAASSFQTHRARGTEANKLPLQNDDVMHNVRASGWDGTAWQAGGTVQVRTTEAWGAAARGCLMRLLVVPNGTTALVTALEANATGAAEEMAILLRDISKGATVRVSRGAADSGGAGFRVLRVPN